MARIDLNSDAGESEDLAADEALLDVVTSVSLACGVHAGSEETIARLSRAAAERGVGVGAHPGLRDGRRERAVDPAEARAAVLDQAALFQRASRAPLQHVKLHGALYHAARDPGVARAVVEAMRALPGAILIAQAGSPLLEAARAGGIPVAAEAFLDRAYRPDGTLVPREQAGALLRSPGEAAARAVAVAISGQVAAVDGSAISLHADTLCIHGDTPEARSLAAAARQALLRAGVELLPLGARSPPRRS